MNIKIIGVAVVGLLVAGLGYEYFFATPAPATLGANSAAVDALVASVLDSARSEISVVTDDTGDMIAVEEQTKDITNDSDLYVQDEF